MAHRAVRPVRFIRRLRGGSQPILVQGDDGNPYVVKFPHGVHGDRALFNEALGSELFAMCGLLGARWEVISVPGSFIERNPGCWDTGLAGSVQSGAMLAFGSQLIAPPACRIFEILSGSEIGRLRDPRCFWLAWILDVCAEHQDNRQAVFAEHSDRHISTYFIDHGLMFGGESENIRPYSALSSRYLDKRLYRPLSAERIREVIRTLNSVDADGLRKHIARLPSDWVSAAAVHALDRCLHRVRTKAVWENLLYESATSKAGLHTIATERQFAVASEVGYEVLA